MKLPGSMLVNEGEIGKHKGPHNLVREKCRQRISIMWPVSCQRPKQGAMGGTGEKTLQFIWVGREDITLQKTSQ